MAEATWNGFLRLSLVSCPVYLSPVTSDRKRVRLDPLNAKTGNPIEQRLVDAKTGDVIGGDALAKGYRRDGGDHVMLSAAELAGVGEVPVDVIDIDSFVPQDEIDRLHLDTRHYLHPEGPLASDTLHALRVAMKHSRRAGLGRMRLGERERLVLIEPHGAGLLLATLHSAEDMEPADFAERAEGDIPAEMVEIAGGLINRRAGRFDAAALGDRYEAALRALIDTKLGEAPDLEDSAAAAAIAAEEPVAAEPEPAGESVAADVAARGDAADRTAEAAAEEVQEQLEAEEQAAAAAIIAEETTTASEPPPQPAAVHETVAEPPAPQDLGAEILLHIVGVGDQRYIDPGWAGVPGSHRQIEALSVRPRHGLAPSAVEFKVFAQEGRATSWVSDGNYAGTRGRGLPLTGFAVRPAPDTGERVEIVYEGSFFEGGVVGPKRNGELCISPVANDPLEAVRISILEHAPAEPQPA